MAIYHFSAKGIGRSSGRSAVAAAAYRSASVLADEREGRTHDFSHKTDVVHSEILLLDGAPERWADRAVLWNEVEAAEKRKDAQLAREVEFALPRELSREEGVTLAHDFVQRAFVSRGMVADLNVHWPVDAQGVDALRALAHQEITGAEHDPVRLLLLGFHRHEAHAGRCAASQIASASAMSSSAASRTA